MTKWRGAEAEAEAWIDRDPGEYPHDTGDEATLRALIRRALAQGVYLATTHGNLVAQSLALKGTVQTVEAIAKGDVEV